MKKLLFCWGGLKRGGSESTLVTLTKHLMNEFEICILCHHNIVEYDISDNIKICSVSESKTTFIGKVINKFNLFKLMLNEAKIADSIVTQEFPLLVIFSFIVAKCLKKELIIWNHSCRSEIQLCKNPIIEIIYKYGFKKANYVINVSNYAEQSLFEYMNEILLNSKVIYNIVEYDSPLPPYRKVDEGNLRILSLGSLNKNKNNELLINATISLSKLYKNLQVIICGDGLEKQHLMSLVQQNESLANIVKFIDKVYSPLDIIRDSDIVVSTSNSESFSLVACEAMILSKPIIVTNTGAAEVVDYGRYGLVIEKNNVKQLVDAVSFVVNNSDLVEEMVLRYEESLSRFESKQICEQWKYIF